MGEATITPLFPFEEARESQKQLISDILEAITQKKHIIAHAPTGLGKTVAALAPALALAEKEDLTVMFLTSRNTQHRIAIETAAAIKEKFGLNICAANMIGKRWMCSQSGIDGLNSSEFAEYCGMLREEDQCEFFLNTKQHEKGLTFQAKDQLSKSMLLSPQNSDEFVKDCQSCGLCPYEMGVALAGKSRLIITDYYFAFHPLISENFLNKIEKSMNKIILIVDEGHNLPGRMRDLLSTGLTNQTIGLARKEAEKFGFESVQGILSELSALIDKLLTGVPEERIVAKDELLSPLLAIQPLDQTISDLHDCAKEVRETQKRSALGSIAEFLSAWDGRDEGFIRFVRRTTGRKGQALCGIYHNCLDPSVVTSAVIESSYSTILMSGTLTPTSMYHDVLGFSPTRTIQKEYSSPFDENNKLALVIPKTSTRFAQRSEAQFKQIAEITSKVCESIKGNVAVFFPSYFVRDSVNNHFSTLCRKTTFLEDPMLNQSGRAELLERFKSYKKSGAVLLGVASGSFGEGIDLPGDLLTGVVVVGLPLSRPDLETNELIKYYDRKFGKGWDYGYVLPAITKTLQNAGRCIRTETDRGAIVFIDERYAWPQYLRCFPTSWNLKITSDYLGEITGFFGRIPSGSLIDY